MKHVTIALAVVSFATKDSWTLDTEDGDHSAMINTLYEKVVSLQCQETIPFKLGEHMYHKKGIYASYIKQNFHGSFQLAEARRILGCPDNNMFATAWVTSSLLEAYMYTDGPKPNEENIKMTLDALVGHHDHNRKYNNSLMTFWEQKYNATLSYYQSTPFNIVEILDLGSQLNMTALTIVMDQLGLKSVVGYIRSIIGSRKTYLQAFQIPPDFDDTSVNLGLGSLLYTAKDDFPEAWETWSSQNTNITSVFDALKKYAYRPFDEDRNVNSIDQRTYMWIRKFLEQAKLEGKNVTLVPTWIQNLDELSVEFYKGVVMPLNINNIDTTVVANTVYAITSSILTGLVTADVLDDPVLESVYHNSSALLAYEINNNMTDRPDIALLYYPSQVEFDWFVARTFSILDASRRKEALPKPVMENVYQMLKKAVYGEMTKFILYQAKYDQFGRVFCDDFLGNDDINPANNKTLNRAEDRMFTTSMAANALLYTWTTVNETTREVRWRPKTPEIVKRTVKGMVDWLTANVLGEDFDPSNAFFTGSGKGPTTYIYRFPNNVNEYLNGTEVNRTIRCTSNCTTLQCIRGHMDQEEYEAQLVKMKSPIDFTSFNDYNGYFPYWSSPAYTYSISSMVFSRYDNLISNEILNSNEPR